MNENQNTLAVINGETLMDMDFPATKFCVETLLPQGTVLYLCLEDSMRRIKERLWKITDEAPDNIHFANEARTINDGLADQLRAFVQTYPDTVLIVIDTFQIIRNNSQDISYASEYEEMRLLKSIADELNVTILLVHHLRKQSDRDPLNMLSGTTGISGALDAVFILEKLDRGSDGATLKCTGRDIQDRHLELRLSKHNCVWCRISDSLTEPTLMLPEPMREFVEFMKQKMYFRGSNTELVDINAMRPWRQKIRFTKMH